MDSALSHAIAGLLGVGLLVVSVVNVSSNIAHASELTVHAAGTCSWASTWTLRARSVAGRLQVDLRLDPGVAGQTWQVRLSDDGSTILSGTDAASVPGGVLAVRTTTRDRAGTDRLEVLADSPATGERCAGVVRF